MPMITEAPRVSRTRQPLGGAAGAAWLMAVAHGTNDAYVAFLHPLLPRLMDRLGLSIALAATLAMTLSIASSLLQPIMGYVADHVGRRWFVAAGPLMTGVFLSSIGLAPGFWTLMLLLVLGGLGSAAFHPPGASMAARVSEGKGSGLRLSMFSFGGALGYAAGPLIAVGTVGVVGFEGLWIAMVPGILMAMLIFVGVGPTPVRHTQAPPPSPRHLMRALAGPLGLVFGISAVGAFVQRVYVTMEPIIVAQAGGTEAAGALALSTYLGAQAVGTLTSGVLTDRVDRRKLLVGLTLAGVPAHLCALLLAPGSIGALAAAAVAGATTMALLPPVVVMAQEMIPDGAAATSGIVMGLAWALGSVGVLGTGLLADAVGPATASALSVPMLLVGTLLALHPALARHARPAPAR